LFQQTEQALDDNQFPAIARWFDLSPDQTLAGLGACIDGVKKRLGVYLLQAVQTTNSKLWFSETHREYFKRVKEWKEKQKLHGIKKVRVGLPVVTGAKIWRKRRKQTNEWQDFLIQIALGVELVRNGWGNYIPMKTLLTRTGYDFSSMELTTEQMDKLWLKRRELRSWVKTANSHNRFVVYNNEVLDKVRDRLPTQLIHRMGEKEKLYWENSRFQVLNQDKLYTKARKRARRGKRVEQREAQPEFGKVRKNEESFLIRHVLDKVVNLENVELQQLPANRMLDFEIEVSDQRQASRSIKQQGLVDGGSTLNIINRKLALHLIDQSVNELELKQGKSFSVDNGSGEPATYEGTHISLLIRVAGQKRTTKQSFFLPPKPLAVDLLLDKTDLRRLGINTYLMLYRDEHEIRFRDTRNEKFEHPANWAVCGLDPQDDEEIINQLNLGMAEEQPLESSETTLDEEHQDWCGKNQQRFELLDCNELLGARIGKKVLSEIRNQVIQAYENWDLNTAERLKELLLKNWEVLLKHKFNFDFIPGVEYEVPLVDDWNGKPINQKPCRFAPDQERWRKAWNDELLEKGIIERSSGSWGSRAFLVTNNDGSKRMVAHYKALNRITKPLAYPVPDVNEVLLDFFGKKVFS